MKHLIKFLVLSLLLLVLSSSAMAATDDCTLGADICSEQAALVAIAQSTEIRNWTSAYHWLSDEHHCYWEGVQCVEERVVGLSLPNKNLVGELPPALGELSKLRTLILANNQITALPEVGGLTALTYMDLSNNQLITMPSLGSLSELRKLVLNGNQLQGTADFLPPAPVYLDLSGNLLTGSLPVPSDLSRLVHYNVSQNQFSGSAPDIVDAPLEVFNISRNRGLDFHMNELPIPTTALRISETGIYGWDGNLLHERLRIFQADETSLSGIIRFDSLPTELRIFTIRETRLGGTLAEFGMLTILNIEGSNICHTDNLQIWLDSIPYVTLNQVCTLSK